MHIQPLRPPPLQNMSASWRELYVSERFAQRQPTWANNFISQAKPRSLNLGVGHKPLEDLDLRGALQPIFFARGGYSGDLVPADLEEHLVFREEQEPAAWETYAWDGDGYPEVTAMYSPWQLLYVEDVLWGSGADIGLGTLLRTEPERGETIDRLRGLLEGQHDAWLALDEGWRPLIKLLVRLQNYYWPRVSGRVTLKAHIDGTYTTAGPESGDDDVMDGQDLLAAVGAEREDVLQTYHWLVERGLDRDPVDGLTMLRRARPRPFHTRWRGTARRAQDLFDAAEVLRRFLTDLDGEAPQAPEGEIMDGRQLERATLYRHGSAAPADSDTVKQLLLEAQLYPHGVVVIGEGPSEQIAVEGIIGTMLGSRGVSEVACYDLEGSGGAVRIEPLLKTFGSSSRASFVIVDREGRMGEYVAAAIKRGRINPDDVALWEDSLEAANATPEELIELVRDLGRNPPKIEGRPMTEPAELTLTAEELVARYADVVDRVGEHHAPGLAEHLLKLARSPEYGSVVVEKLDLAEALTDLIAQELHASSGKELEELKARRPLVGFVLDRIVPHLNPPRPLG